MATFTSRSGKKELLDGSNIPFADIKQNMQELDVINRFLGGHQITIAGVKSLLQNSLVPELHIAEIGCGGGDNLAAIKKWAEGQGVSLRLTGVDINPSCIAFAQTQPKNAGINFMGADYKNVRWSSQPHIIFTSLFCHHFSDAELIKMLKWMRTNTAVGFFINDLHRHPLAYFSIKIITQLLSKSYLVKNDAPLSVQRAFVRKDWQYLLKAAGIENYTCNWKWAFRWLVTFKHV